MKWKHRFAAAMAMVLFLSLLVSPAARASTVTPGYSIRGGIGITGVRGYISTGRNVSFDSSPTREILLAQSFRAPGSCLELAVFHHRYNGAFYNSVGVGPWCGASGYTYFYQPIDAAWAAKYAVVQNWSNWDWIHGSNETYTDEMMYVTIQRWSADCWSVYLMNYQTGLWEAIGNPNYRCGTSSNADGWAVYDIFDFNVSPMPICNQLGTYNVLQFRSLQYQTSVGGVYSWMPASAFTTIGADGGTYCANSSWVFHRVVYGSGSPHGLVLCAKNYQANCD